MKVNQLHGWQLSVTEAKQIQVELASYVTASNALDKVRFIAGIDVSITQKSTGRAAIVILSYPDFKIVEINKVEGRINFPYVPGLLSFREAPIALSAFEKLSTIPDIVLADGQGIAHPRRFGLASHLGLLLDLPTIGCAKSLLCGSYAPLGIDRGSFSELIDNDQIIGVALRTKTNVKPVFVSIGHKIDLQNAINWVLKCCQYYRLPEPCRLAHLASLKN